MDPTASTSRPGGALVLLGGSPGLPGLTPARVRSSLASRHLDLLTIGQLARAQACGDGGRVHRAETAAGWMQALDWLGEQQAFRHTPVGLWAMGDAVAPALLAAASRPDRVRAVAAMEGRPEQLGERLTRVAAATLLIVTERAPSAQAGHAAWRLLPSARRLETLPRAAGPDGAAWRGACELAANWLQRHLGAGSAPP